MVGISQKDCYCRGGLSTEPLLRWLIFASTPGLVMYFFIFDAVACCVSRFCDTSSWSMLELESDATYS